MAPYFVSALRNEVSENDWYRYYANAGDGQAATLTYSFLNSVPAGTENYYGNPRSSFEKYTNAEKSVVRDALAMIEAVANIHFKETTRDPDLKFGQFDIDTYAGYAFYPIYDKEQGGVLHGVGFGEIWLDVDFVSTSVALHEIGHSLGLEHPFEGDTVLRQSEDNSVNTVMSYTGMGTGKLGLYDIIALQSIYGPAERRMGNDSYEFGKDKLIWDGGGTDQITAAGARSGVTIDLNDGSWNFIGSKAGSFLDDGKGAQVFIGYFTEIENLVGSSHNDRLTGNELANRIRGGSGNDQLVGKAGNDVLYGGSGNDRLEGGLGRDYLNGEGGSDTFIYRSVKDSTVAVSGRDTIFDFTKNDRIDLHFIDADTTRSGNQFFDFIATRAFTGEAGELRFEKKPSDTYIYGDVNGDGKADFMIHLDDAVSLKEDMFIL